jgi:hypothetical protein
MDVSCPQRVQQVTYSCQDVLLHTQALLLYTQLLYPLLEKLNCPLQASDVLCRGWNFHSALFAHHSTPGDTSTATAPHDLETKAWPGDSMNYSALLQEIVILKQYSEYCMGVESG